ncbi:hypothetical protein KV102_02065 [Mumia sp. zg.B53]|uniref:hypothetical protein n=1 Tax=unclassified Mumia TaxID=2621872 RepID=UPI001C6E4F3A|nr:MULTISPECIES: hypothetical protein [unclassified Mumia]MBW9209005.1 hypothetical protein [Mumia sp. zg.B21]MBW9213616.1 hypothetical protein [Mumia sp. zg.B53]MDD9347480.1 hypothetical protein [Mumia sp.]
MNESVDMTVFWAVVAARLLVPLLIFTFPLPGIVACMLLDGVDQTIFQTFTSLDLTHYQSYDKALDVFYLSLAYVATMRNWTSRPAFEVARFLFFYRLVGTTIFELTGGTHRWLLLVFPNTFEYFFIFYELVRLRWDPKRFSMRWWIAAAAVIWVVIKIPQEAWIHVFKLDLTDTIRDVDWFLPAMVFAALVLAAVFWFVVRPRLAPPDHAWQVVAPPIPAEIDRERERAAFRVAHGKVLDAQLGEKTVIVALVSIIIANIVPSVRTSPFDIAVSCTVLVVVNSFLGLWTARRGGGLESAVTTFFALSALNIGLVLVASLVLPNNEQFFLTAGFFFVFLLTLIVSLYDRYRPVLDVRTGGGRTGPVASAP